MLTAFAIALFFKLLLKKYLLKFSHLPVIATQTNLFSLAEIMIDEINLIFCNDSLRLKTRGPKDFSGV